MTTQKTHNELANELAKAKADHTALASRVKALEIEAAEAKDREESSRAEAMVTKAFTECPRRAGQPHVLVPVEWSIQVDTYVRSMHRDLSAEARCRSCGVQMTLKGLLV